LSQNLQARSRVQFILIISVTGLFLGAPDISVNLLKRFGRVRNRVSHQAKRKIS